MSFKYCNRLVWFFSVFKSTHLPCILFVEKEAHLSCRESCEPNFTLRGLVYHVPSSPVFPVTW